jgi:sugar/nucleoside kinase (ribokinase family)
MRRPVLGVAGTLVWDRFLEVGADAVVREGWGGIAYSLAALAVALPEAWVVRPLVKLGADRADEGRALLADAPRTDLSGLLVVPEPNNLVELRYTSDDERTERLSGGVPPWEWGELAPRLTGCDALYVNFVSGHEMSLETARSMARGFDGPTYADLHSLFLDMAEDGTRIPRRLERAPEWVACFDAVQLNERELERLTDAADPWSSIPDGLPDGPALFAITRGSRGSVAVVGEEQDRLPRRWSAGRGVARRPTEIVTLPTRPKSGDPTGCGDVWGAAMFARLLAGDDVEVAMSVGNRLGGLNVSYRVAEGLARYLACPHPIEYGAELREAR